MSQEKPTGWRPMTEHAFPWDHDKLLVAAFAKDDQNVVDVLRVHVGEHGALFFYSDSWLSVHEQGWVPFAWRLDDAPDRDDERWPPMWTDYLTEGDHAD